MRALSEQTVVQTPQDAGHSTFIMSGLRAHSSLSSQIEHAVVFVSWQRPFLHVPQLRAQTSPFIYLCAKISRHVGRWRLVYCHWRHRAVPTDMGDRKHTTCAGMS
jgi:hypothetical protein